MKLYSLSYYRSTKIKKEFDNMLVHNVYDLFPDVLNN